MQPDSMPARTPGPATFNPCAVIPVYNHPGTVRAVVERVRAAGLPCVLVDDGSNAECARTLDDLAAAGLAQLLRRPVNGGKGQAVQDGLRHAGALGYSHALQIDADGQHALDDIPAFLDAARHRPDAVICGAPAYGADAPRSRLYGRWLTRVWVWINTLSRAIPDAMCGFRVYPLAPTLALLRRCNPGRRMDFDIAVLVRLHWRGVPMVWLPTRVSYPVGGISHFKGLRDNLLISRMHARLFFGMLPRAPRLLARRLMGRTP
ncbi:MULTISPECIES: glycosyltransferase family 2 protein [unclassified Achromobacter]|uniref:glycosyltransferase family 2 protein n=1 Tax=unclassified Achromobacter TaxID=2626865 RepID=UPI001E42FB89|nr:MULTISPECIES: glycosyltransferase family 2 protein [unclassified Achromobacter]